MSDRCSCTAEIARLGDVIAKLRRALEREPRDSLVDAKTLARELGVTEGHVRRNAKLLGGVRVGKGEKAPWRFDAERARLLLAENLEPPPPSPLPKPRRRRPRPSAPLLPIREDEAA